MSWSFPTRPSRLACSVRTLNLVPVLFVSIACAKLGPECERLSECCETLEEPTTRRGCLDALDEHGTDDGAETYCQSAVSTFERAGVCRSGDTEARKPPPASAHCSALRSCCEQISSGPYRADCLVAVGQMELQPEGSTSCRLTLEGYQSDGWCQIGPRLVAEETDETCRDGLDNDRNGFVDCEDFGCSRNPNVTICRTPEDNVAACSDGRDNDGNGFVDCEDFGCLRNPNVTICRTPEDNDAACSDGRDNDGDRYVDCDDYDCSRNPNVTVCG